jgi:hypothetical protein
MTLLVFSGCPNYQQDITDPDDIETLRGFLQGLTPTSPPDWPDLGWRGFLLASQDVPDFPVLLRVFQGVIELDDGFFRDVNGLEDWLSDRVPDFDSDGVATVDELSLGTDPFLPGPGGCPAVSPPSGPTEAVALQGGTCNPVTSTFADGTPATTVAAAVQPAGILQALWEFEAGIWLGFSPQFPEVSDLRETGFLHVVFVCIGGSGPSAGTISRPVV